MLYVHFVLFGVLLIRVMYVIYLVQFMDSYIRLYYDFGIYIFCIYVI